MKFNIVFRVLIIALAFNGYARSEYITQINIRQASIVDSVYIKLLENDAPLTVQNFRNYVSDGDYTNSFFHRGISDFIFQGGGFSFDPALNDGSFIYDKVNDLYPGGFQRVPEDSPVINEFSNSNLRGTWAMAKLPTGPDTATSQWFVNLVDNDGTVFTNLDTQNGGFTVFAETLGNGMDVIDGAVAGAVLINLTDFHPSFDSIPLLMSPVPNDNLVFVDSINEILSISADINYGTVTPGTNLQPEVVIQNTGVDSVSIGDIGGLDSVTAPYNLVSDLCSNTVLAPGQRCSLIALFSPESPGVVSDSFDVNFPDLGINYLIKLSGEGGVVADEADIASSFSSVEFGEHDVLFSPDDPPYTGQLVISNTGKSPLDLLAIALSPDSDPEFIIDGDDCINTSTLAPGDGCIISVSYLPMVGGSHTAKLILESNDPDESLFEIPIFGAAVAENDGINKDIEDAAPNNGDGNNDDILDSRQSHVVSFPDLKSTYLTYLSYWNQSFLDVRVADQNVLDENPDNVILEAGVHEFTLDDVALDAVVEVGLMLPANINPSAYYIYGPTPENSVPHWYKFDFDGETGAKFKGTAIIPSPTGDITRNLVKLYIKNGGRGDSSSVQDTNVVVKSGINYGYVDNNDGGGFLSFLFLLTTTLTCFFMRGRRFFGCFYRWHDQRIGNR